MQSPSDGGDLLWGAQHGPGMQGVGSLRNPIPSAFNSVAIHITGGIPRREESFSVNATFPSNQHQHRSVQLTAILPSTNREEQAKAIEYFIWQSLLQLGRNVAFEMTVHLASCCLRIVKHSGPDGKVEIKPSLQSRPPVLWSAYRHGEDPGTIAVAGHDLENVTMWCFEPGRKEVEYLVVAGDRHRHQSARCALTKTLLPMCESVYNDSRSN